MRGVSGANVGGWVVGPCKKLPSIGSTVGVGVGTRMGTRVGSRVGVGPRVGPRVEFGSTLIGVLVVGPIEGGAAVTGASVRSGGGAIAGGAIALQTSTSGQNAAPRDTLVKLAGGMSSGLSHNSPNGKRQ